MRKSLLRLVFLTCAVVAISCKPPVTNVAEVRRAIEEAGAKQVSAFNTKDAATCVSFYAPDVVIMSPTIPTVIGRDKAEAMLRQSIQVARDFRITTKTVDADGDLAYRTGEYTIVLELPGMPAVNDTGKFVDVWKRQPDGKWLIVVDILNSSLSAPPSPQAVQAKKKR